MGEYVKSEQAAEEHPSRIDYRQLTELQAPMRGADVFSEQLFTIKRLEELIAASHPLRPVREMVNEVFQRLDGLVGRMYEPSHKGGVN